MKKGRKPNPEIPDAVRQYWREQYRKRKGAKVGSDSQVRTKSVAVLLLLSLFLVVSVNVYSCGAFTVTTTTATLTLTSTSASSSTLTTTLTSAYTSTLTGGSANGTVASKTSGSDWIQYCWQRKSFYANGLFWVFYHDNILNQVNYSTSSDGVTWTYRGVIRTDIPGSDYFNVFYSSSLNVFDYAMSAYGAPYYRRGTPNADGSITWATSEQSLPSEMVWWLTISIDSTGYPWVVGVNGTGGGDTHRALYIVKSSSTDGTWTTASGFPYLLKGPVYMSGIGEYAYWAGMPIPLTNQKILVIYSCDGQPMMERRWDGSTWASELVYQVRLGS